MAAPTIMVLDPTDTVAVVLSDMEAGETRDGLTAQEPIHSLHDVARRFLGKGGCDPQHNDGHNPTYRCGLHCALHSALHDQSVALK